MGKIYVVSGQGTDKVYIGSTTKPTVRTRFMEHKRNYRQWKKGNHSNLTIFQLFDLVTPEKCQVEKLSEIMVMSHRELLKEEEKWRQEYRERAINRCCYREDRIERMKEAQRKFRETHRESRNMASRLAYHASPRMYELIKQRRLLRKMDHFMDKIKEDPKYV